MKSYLGLFLCPLYLFYAGGAVVADVTRGPSPLIMPDATMIVAFPGLVVVMLFAGPLGVTHINDGNRLPVYVPSVLVTAALLYLLCAAAEWLLRAVFRACGRPRARG